MRLAVAFCALMASVGSASAGDHSDWSGFYAGVHAGGVYAEFTNNLPFAPGPFDEAGSVMGGAQIGYNWQSDRLVFGAEADVSFMDIVAKSASGRFEEQVMGTVRLRAGYTFGRYLAYITGGLGLTDKDHTVTGLGSASRVEAGFAAGAGVEAMFSDMWSVRTEYLYVDVPKDSQNIGGVSSVGGSDNHVFRAALNYHF